MKILTLGRTDVHVVPSFLILMGLFVLLAMENREPWQVAVLWIPVIFISVLFHEGGHAAANSVLGLGSSQIILGGFGGVTINRSERHVWQGILVSLAGPLFSFILAGLFYVLRQHVPFLASDPMFSELVPRLIVANVVWGIFNLLPVFPMDGGQAFYGVAQYVASPRRALLISIWSSFFFGAVLLVLGLLASEYFVVIIVGFLLFQNYQRFQILKGPPSDQ